jgi:hypothetical protein
VTDLRKILDSDGKELGILRQWAIDLSETEAGCKADDCLVGADHLTATSAREVFSDKLHEKVVPL